MSGVERAELKIVGFLCNWCSYGGADTAGVSRFKQPTDLRIIRVPCSGRVDPLFVVKAFMGGADGVLVSGCHPRDCHYAEGNYYARRRLEVLKRYLPVLGIDANRFEYTWVSASEGARWQTVVTDFTDQIAKLGPGVAMAKEGRLKPAPSRAALKGEAPSRASRAEGVVARAEGVVAAAEVGMAPAELLGPQGGGSGAWAAQLDQLKGAVKKALPRLDRVIGWGPGYDALHNTPLFARDEKTVDQFTWGPLSVHNLATYLPRLKGKTGIVVKGCDSRSVLQLLQEKLVDRENLVIFGMPCDGVVDLAKIARSVDVGRVEAVSFDDGKVRIKAGGAQHTLERRDVLAEKCLGCRHPNPLIADEQFGAERTPAVQERRLHPDLQRLASMTLTERLDYWNEQMDRCIRCYACRNVCPMCVCKEQCIAESRNPHWLSGETGIEQKWMFQLIHTLHLAGRCTECGECERACPMGIPILAMRSQMNKEVAELFDYEAGVQPNARPPLSTFQVEEPRIKEREW